MNNSTVNFTTSETSNSTTSYTILIDSLNIFMYCIGFIFGFPTHSYVLWLIVTGSSGVAASFFNINLAFCEIGICLNCLVYAISYCFFSFSNVKQFFVGLTITGRPLFQCLICVERYLAVVHPVTFLKYKPLRYRVICCAPAWIIILGSCLICMYTLNEKGRYLYTWFFSTQFLIFLSIQLFCLVAVLRALKQSGPGERKKEENHMKRRAFHLILITTASMAIIYGPFTIIGFVTIVVNELIDPLWFAGFTCYVLAGFVHPFLYLLSTGKISCLSLPKYVC
ncbi:uracil nucleotide/cysteinyl leukotriene receptor-like [Danio aesculapii]|uniref:uracil nucleotide/cysteinyl leukotriene receptor-like n=1 Tax=Danio aesculapii TaxID=1142201 RepID=UPI0024C05078|nr:uracil nucleotide/cysteinyl leukotriene receptor-like [Danio aesculapii]